MTGPTTTDDRREAADLLERVDRHLRDGRPRDALQLLPGGGAPWARNARAVCLLRLGRPAEAVDALRDLVFDPSGFAVRAGADPAVLANYATALLLDGNADGFWSILAAARDRDHPAVRRVDEAVRRWRAGLPAWRRVALALGLGGPRPVLDVDPGAL